MVNFLFIYLFLTMLKIIHLATLFAAEDVNNNNNNTAIITINHQTIIEDCLKPMNVEFSDSDLHLNLKIQPLNYKPIDYWPKNSKINTTICYFGRIYQLLLWKEKRRMDFGVSLYKDNDVTNFDWKIPNIFGSLIDPNSTCDLVFYGVLERGILLGRIYDLQCEKSINQQIRRATEEFNAKLLAQQLNALNITKSAATNENDAEGKEYSEPREFKEKQFRKDCTSIHSFIVDDTLF